VIISLREQAQQQNRSLSTKISSQQQLTPNGSSAVNSPKPSFIPYRNSILTNMLRDSLGGNCKSCFLLMIATEKLHFEETVATCRFGQRCGEVKVKISANTEIGLSDQLKELNHRLKVLEKKLTVSEERRRLLEGTLSEEKELRRIQTEQRDLLANEKSFCKTCVQDLLTAAKDSLASSSTSKETADEIIAKSQDLLYEKVSTMDKAVLVELSTALGGLVQSMFIERELTKQDEITKEQLRKQKEEEQNEIKVRETKQLEIIFRGDYDTMISSPSFNTLPSVIVSLLNRGTVFIKYSRLGKKIPRLVAISPDLKTLLWKPVITGKEEFIHVPLNDYEE
jgi:cellobiose-specific phosphotransferase system component IIA